MNKNSSPIKRLVILGHNGFLGSQISQYFETHSSQIEIIGISFPEIDLTKIEDVHSLCKLFDMDTVVVFCSGIKKQWGDTLDNFNQNLKMVLNVCQILEKHPVKQLLYLSSAEVYGEEIENPAINEDTPVHPTSYYGIAKYTSEKLLQKMLQTHKMTSLTVLRPPLIYGAGDESRGYGPTGFCWAAAEMQEIVVWGDGSERREFVYIKDFARIVFQLVERDVNGVVNIASGISHTYQEVLEILNQLLPKPLSIRERQRSKKKVDQGYDNKLLKSKLGDFKFTSIEDGLRETLLQIQENMANH